jgi:ubiquinone/menaquinone biosynthesis C-methylase UbiE
MSKPRLEPWIVCPLCQGALLGLTNTIECATCHAAWSQSLPNIIDLFPRRFEDDDTSRWVERQDFMLGWYRRLMQSPEAAVECLTSDYNAISPTLKTYGGRVLDLGGGAGLTRGFLRQGTDYTVLDPAVEWLSLKRGTLQRVFPDLDLSSRFVRGVGERLPFAAESFDVVVALWTLNHVSKPREVIAECGRVLPRGGRLLLVIEDVEIGSPISGDSSEPSVPARELQPDHIAISESEVLGWISDTFACISRQWASDYRMLEFVREGRPTPWANSVRPSTWETFDE